MRLVLVAAGLALAASVGAQAKVPRVAYLGFLGEPAEGSPLREAFIQGLRDLGYVPGRTVSLDVRRYGSAEEFQREIAEALRARPDVIFVGPPFAAAAARRATRDIAIICGSCGDPVENGIAASLARPGGNVTGLASLSSELIGKRTGLLKELLPDLSRIAVLVFPENPGTPPTLRALDSVARDLGIEMRRFEIRRAADFDDAFRRAAADSVRGVVIQDDPLVRAARRQLAELALKHRLPMSAGLVEVAEAGGLIVYGPDRIAMSRRAATFADRIFKGAKPGDLPFEQASKLDLVVNQRTARALGVAVPTAMLLRADRVIE
jgi:putative ABC transport system substrate-binding protein